MKQATDLASQTTMADMTQVAGYSSLGWFEVSLKEMDIGILGKCGNGFILELRRHRSEAYELHLRLEAISTQFFLEDSFLLEPEIAAWETKDLIF